MTNTIKNIQYFSLFVLRLKANNRIKLVLSSRQVILIFKNSPQFRTSYLSLGKSLMFLTSYSCLVHFMLKTGPRFADICLTVLTVDSLQLKLVCSVGFYYLNIDSISSSLSHFSITSEYCIVYSHISWMWMRSKLLFPRHLILIRIYWLRYAIHVTDFVPPYHPHNLTFR